MELWPPWITLVLISMLTQCHDGMAQQAFTIDWVKLTFLPDSMVKSGTNVTLRCEAKVSHSFSQLIHNFSFLMDNIVIYSKNSSEAMVERSLTPARASNSGPYMCRVQIRSKEKSSSPQILNVTGLQTPQLTVEPDTVNEGGKLTATCSAPEETGSLHFYFFKDGKEFRAIYSSKSSVTITVEFQGAGENNLHCNYKLALHRSEKSSNNSKTVKVVVREVNITPSLNIEPGVDVVEGDRVDISCNVTGYSQRDIEIFLIKNRMLQNSQTAFTHSFQASSEDSGEYVCKAEKGNVQKVSTAKLSVAELFSVPVLRMDPKQVYERQHLSLNCRSSVISQNRINHTDVKYTLYKNQQLLKAHHIFNTTANQIMNGNYTCVAEAKGIRKTSKQLTVNVKVPVSIPLIQTVGNVIIKRPFQIRCESEHGTLPITYTLLKSQKPVDTKTVTGSPSSALFNISYITYKEEIHSFACHAQNQGADYTKTSQALSAAVIEPVSSPELTIYPRSHAITEGMNVTLYCSVKQGTVPVTFTWYYSESIHPLNTKHISNTKAEHTVKDITREQRGRYRCEATNDAKVTKESNSVTIGVNLAGWKKAVIAVICILISVLIITILVLFLKKAQTPRKRKRAVELSVKPVRPKSDDPMRMSLTLEIEDNTVINTSPGLMGKNVWSENVSDSESDDPTKEEESERLQYVKVHPKESVDNEIAPIMQEPDTVTGEAQDCTEGVKEESAADSAVEYVQLNHCKQDSE